jgi:hypothetical protein
MKYWLVFFAGYFLGNLTRAIAMCFTSRHRDRRELRELFRSIERSERL